MTSGSPARPTRPDAAPAERPPAATGTGPAGDLALLLVAAAAAFLLYAPALDAGFVAEDFESLRYGGADLLAEATSPAGLPGWRPGTTLVFTLLEPLFGRSPAGYRSLVLLLHAVCAVAVFRLAERTLRSRAAAAFAAALFLGAPVHAEAVVWLAAAAGTVTSSALVLAACLVWTRSDGPPLRRDRWLAAALALLALAFKETALTFLPLFAVLDLALGRWRADRAEPSAAAALRRGLDRYLALLAALGVFLLVLASTGAWRSLVDYAAGERLQWRERLVVWSAYAHDLLRPLAPDKSWSISPPLRAADGVEIWALAATAVVVVALGRRRWTALWTFAALAPGVSKYGERLTYLAVAGAAFAAAALLLELRDRFSRSGRRWSPAVGRASWSLLTLGALAADRAALAPELANWVAAGRYAARIPPEVKALVPAPPHGAKFYFRGLVDNVDGAYSLRMGVQPELRRVYDDESLEAYIVADRRPRGRRILLSQIACDDPTPRYFIVYDRDRDRLSRLDPLAFGLDCPGSETAVAPVAPVAPAATDRSRAPEAP